MKRKDFLKLSSTGVAGLLFSNSIIGHAFNSHEIDQIKNGDITEVIIIGTGYGASVTALRLAQSGIRCLMIEMGMDWSLTDLPFSGMAFPKKQSTWLKSTSIAPFGNFSLFSKFTGALDRIDFKNIKIYAGRGVGGGSLVNGGMAVTPRKDYFQEIFPELNSDDFFKKYFPLANTELGVSLIPEDYYKTSEYYKFSRTGELEGKKAGFNILKVPNVYDFEYMKEEEAGNVPKSGLNGEVIYGNNHGKKDLTKTYLHKALETGLVSILPLHKVEQITQLPDNTYALNVSELNTSGKTIEKKVFNTKKLFLGAGSLGTTELLLKSKAKGTLPNINDDLGKYWGNNGNVMTGRNFLSTGTGSKQSSIPVAGIDGWKDDMEAFFAEIAPLPIGLEVVAALYLVINKVPYYGAFSYNEKKDKLELDWDTKQNAQMIANTKKFIKKMNAENGGIIAGLLFNLGIGADICYHPLGGCVLGKVTDNFGRVKNNPGLYVTDGALVPASIGVNPFVTITALAEYAIEDVIKNDFNTLSTPSVSKEHLDIKAYPIPFKNELNISFFNTNNEKGTIQIFDVSQKLVYDAILPPKQGNQVVTIKNINHLSNGNYILKLSVGSKTFSKKIIK